MIETLRKAQSDKTCINIVTASVSAAVSPVGMIECKSTPTLLYKRRGKRLETLRKAQSDVSCTNIVTASVSVAVSSVGMRECKSTPTLL